MIGSLSRITGFLNSVHRVKLMQSLKSIDWFKSIRYLDGNYLVLKNSWLDSSVSFNLASNKYNLSELGKW